MSSLISVIMPYWRYSAKSAVFLEAALACLVRQTYQDFEVRFGLDCPTPEAATEAQAVIRKFRTPLRGRLTVSTRKDGAPNISLTRNGLMEVAGGDWFAFLDADNTWDSGWLQTMLDVATEISPDIPYCHGHDGTETPFRVFPKIDSDHFKYYLNHPSHPLFGQVFLHRDHLEKVGWDFDSELLMYETSLMMVKLFKHFKLRYVPDAHLLCRRWTGAISHRTPHGVKLKLRSLFQQKARIYWDEL